MEDRQNRDEDEIFGCFEYKGELDQFGFACGEGYARSEYENYCLYGTWYADKPHGICKPLILLISLTFYRCG